MLDHVVFSDGTLRLVDHVGIRAEVCMLGDTVGQIASVITEMDISKVTDISLVMGANDVKSNDVTSELVNSLKKPETVIDEKKETTKFCIMNSTAAIK